MDKYNEALEKAKAYDKALKLMRDCVPDENGLVHVRPSDIFSELKESEGEEIKEYLISFIKMESGVNLSPDDAGKILAWLEKQGEQKPINDIDEDIVETVEDTSILDMVEPKFKVGNWYQCTKDFFGKGVTFDKNTAYYCAEEGCLKNEYGCHIAIVKDLYDNFKLWTIQDAKDGDVLVCPLPKKYGAGEQIFIFKGINSRDYVDNCIEFYCRICQGYFYENKIGFMGTTDGIFHPATKEQRDLLFQKMKEAGYTFDFDKKELKKIDNEEVNGEVYGIDGLYHAQRILEKTLGRVDGYQSDDGILEHKCAISAVKKLYEQKPAWSEADDEELEIVINALKGAGRHGSVDWLSTVKWLLTIKQRIGG